jgi:hypothetical protein
MPSRARRRYLLRGIGCVALVVGACATFTPAQPVFPPGRERIENLLDRAADDTADEIPPERAVKFAMDGEDLAVTTGLTLPGDAGVTALRVRGLEGITRVEVGERPRGVMGMLHYFELTHTGAANNDGAGAAQTMISAHGASIRIMRVTQLRQTHTTLTLTQNAVSRRGRPIDAPGERIKLSIRSVRTGEAQPVEDYRLSASSFAELLRQNAGPTTRHLAPIFRDFNQDEKLFRVDPRVAWQVFPNAADADEQTASRVLALLDRLDDDDFRVRELATAELEVIGGPAMLVLGEVDRGDLSPEQNTRVDAIQSRYRQLDEEEAALLRDDTEFILRCFVYSDLQPVRAAAVHTLGRKIGDAVDLKLDPRDKLAVRIRAAERLRAKLDPEL